MTINFTFDDRKNLPPRVYRSPAWVRDCARKARLSADIFERMDPVKVWLVFCGAEDPKPLMELFEALGTYHAYQDIGMCPTSPTSLPPMPAMCTIRFDYDYALYLLGPRCRVCSYPISHDFHHVFQNAAIKMRVRERGNPRYCIQCWSERHRVPIELAAKDYVAITTKVMRRTASRMVRDERFSDDDIVRAVADEVWGFTEWLGFTKRSPTVTVRMISQYAVDQALRLLNELKWALKVGSSYEAVERAWAIEEDDGDTVSSPNKSRPQ